MRYSVREVLDLLHEGRFIELIEPEDMRNGLYGVTVIPYLGGQYRIQLLRMDFPMDINIVREMCTYKADTARTALADLKMAEDPEDYCRTLESVFNCEAPGRGRIRLDQTPENTRHPLRQYENAD